MPSLWNHRVRLYNSRGPKTFCLWRLPFGVEVALDDNHINLVEHVRSSRTENNEIRGHHGFGTEIVLHMHANTYLSQLERVAFRESEYFNRYRLLIDHYSRPLHAFNSESVCQKR